ncbi:MAG: response regulator [Pseudomonadota bacterium]
MYTRRNSWLLFVCLLCCFIPVSGHANDAETRLQNITVVSDDNYPPYIFRDSNGAIQGILVDEWKLWENKTGIKVNLIAMDWSKAQEFLLRGNADVIDTIFFTAERAKQYDFTEPYATIDVPVFFHKNLGGITDIASLKGFTIGVKAGDACIEVLKKQGLASLQEYNSYETIINAAVDGEIKVFSIDKPPALYYLYKMNFENEFRCSFNLYTGEFHRAVKKGRSDILKIVEDGFALINKKEHDGIEKKWMGESFVRPVYLRYVLFVFLFSGALFLVLIFFNITLRRKVRAKTSELHDLVNQLRLSEEKYRNLFNNSEVGIFRSRLDGSEVMEINQKFLDIVGMTREETLGKPSVNLWADPKEREEMVKRLVANGSVSAFEYKMLNKRQGDVRNCLTSLRLYREQGILEGSILDITERKMAEEERTKLQAQLANAMEMAHLGHWEYNVAKDLFTFNDHFYKIFHTSAEQIGGYTMSSAEYARRFVHPDDMRIVEEETRKAIEATDPHFSRQLEHRVLYADGTVGHITVRFFIVKDAHGRTVKTYGVNQDITEYKRMEEELLRSQKMESIGNLAGGIAHDFNNILSSIIGFTELALDEVEKDTNIEDSLQEVYAAGKRAKDLVKQILAFARQTEEEIKPTQVDTIAKEVLKLIRSSIPTTIEIKQNIESDSLVMSNATQLHQIFMNLFTNAAHAMEDEGGILELSLKDIVINGSVDMQGIGLNPGNYLQIRVSDTGVGIPPDILGSIFDPYFTTKGPGEGTGMGLAMVHGIVEIYGGKVTVDSRLGDGTAFTIYLPITRKRKAHSPCETEELPSGSERILFIDDEASIAKMGSQVLERLGYLVTTRTSSVEALELFRSKPNHFDLVITDMTMPNMTGDTLAVELMKIRPDIPVILCTGYSKKISNDSATAIGIKAFAYKPIVKVDLAKTVRKVLDDQQQEQTTGRILLIDDDSKIRKLFIQKLAGRGYEIIEACDGKEGLRLYHENRPDLVITDLVMPEKEGIEMITELKREFPNVKIIAISGGGRNVQDAYLHIAKSLGAERTFTKPIDWPELIKAVSELLG